MEQQPLVRPSTNPYLNPPNGPATTPHQQPAAIPIVYPAATQPSYYLTMTIVVTIICGFFNISSLLFGIPALVVASAGSKTSRQQLYAATKILGYIALSLNLANIMYTAIVDVVIIFIATYTQYIQVS